jgi:hypothetical protein
MIQIFRDGMRKLLNHGLLGQFLAAPVGNATQVATESTINAGQWTGNIITSAAIVADTIYAVRTTSPARGGIIQELIARFGVISAGNVRVGLYKNVADDRDMYPGQLVFGSESMALVASTDLRAICQKNLDPLRSYWLALTVDVNQAAVTVLNTGTTPGSGHDLGILASSGTQFNMSLVVAAAYAALPDPFPAGAVWGTVPVVVKARYGA